MDKIMTTKNLKNNCYTIMQKSFYKSGTSNHPEHNKNKNYWNILLKDLKEADKWKNKNALDFACGKGRNVINMLSLCDWKEVDGVDISEGNIKYCKETYDNQKSNWFMNNGFDLSCMPEEKKYDFIMSTIALQHIPVYDIRKNLITDMYNRLNPGGIFSFQMGYGNDLSDPLNRPRSHYYENAYSANSTNSSYDVRILNSDEVINDMKTIGFKEVTTIITDTLSDEGEILDIGHPQWIWIRCIK